MAEENERKYLEWSKKKQTAVAPPLPSEDVNPPQPPKSQKSSKWAAKSDTPPGA